MLYRSNSGAGRLTHTMPGAQQKPRKPFWRIGLTALFVLALLGTGLFFAATNLVQKTHAAPTDKLPAIGINFDSPGAGGLRAFADAMKTARPNWAPTSDVLGSGIPTDENGWPTQDASILVWEGSTNNHGTYKLIFNGQADLSTSFNYGTFSDKNYDASTNTTTATMVVTDTGLQNFGLIFTNTKRTANSATNTGVTNVRLMRPTSPGSNTSFADGTVWTPWIRDAVSAYSYIRFMGGTNWNTSTNWSDRTRPNEATQTKVLPGESGFERNNIAFEYMVLLCNETGKDLYINIPHKATDDYMTKVAQLVKYGSDGVNPYTSPQSNPVFPPLNSNLNVYVEYSNELWNFGFQQSHDVYDTANAEVKNGNSPLNWDGETGSYAIGYRYPAKRTVEMSKIFRSVFGDSAMGSRVRPLLFWQYDNLNNTASILLEFLNTYYNNADGIQHVSDPHPPSYYIWGGGGAVYFNSGNDNASTVDEIFNSGMPRFGGQDTYQQMLFTEAAWARAYGLHYVAYEGGWAVGGDFGETAVAHQAKLDPRAKQIMLTSFNIFARSGGDLYTAGTYSQWDEVTKASTYPLWQAANDITNGNFTPDAVAQGTEVSGSGATIAANQPSVRSDYNTGTGATTSVGKSVGYLLRVTQAGNYSISLNAGNNGGDGKVNVFVDGNKLSTVNIPNTGSTTSYQQVDAGSVYLTTGAHAILIRGVAPAGGSAGGIDTIKIGSGGSGTPPTPVPTDPPGSNPTPTPAPGGGGGSATYLSDLNWSSASNGYGDVQKDKSNNGNTLTLNGTTYSKGLGVHAASEIVYNLNGSYSKFTADAGIDDESWAGSVQFQVFADGNKVYDSGVVTGSSDTQHIDVSINGAKELKLVVLDGGDGINSDHADWANAQVS